MRLILPVLDCEWKLALVLEQEGVVTRVLKLLSVLEKNQGGYSSRRRSHMDMDSGVPASTRTTSFRCLL
jgi:hypothetical protein